MADWSNPQLTSTYTNFVTEVKNRDVDLALQFDGTTSTNLTTGTIRWSSSANRWQKWSGSVWAELTGTYALTGLSTTGAATIGTTLGVSGVTTLSGGGTSTTAAIDNNSTNIATTAYVVGQASGTTPVMNGTATVGTSLRYARQDHVHPSDTTRAPLASPTFTGTVTIPAGASISGYAPLDSPTFTGTPATVTAAVGTNTTQIASTAYVKSEISNSNAASATTAASCSGNSATATTAASCSGNSATATTAASCSGNAATATALSTTSGSAPSYSARVWVTFNGTTATPSTIRASGNVSSVTKNATGDFTINFATALPDANFTAVTGGDKNTAAGGSSPVIANRSFAAPGGTASTLRINTGQSSGSQFNDTAYVDVVIFR